MKALRCESRQQRRPSANPHRTKLTPPEIAAEYGVSPEKVLAWIRNGELAAINAATRLGGRPRYLIDRVAIEEFETRRAVVAKPKTATTRRRAKPTDVIEYF